MAKRKSKAKRRKPAARATKKRRAKTRRAKTHGTKTQRAKASPMRAVEAALAGVAHDIRTPLTGIVALAELLASSDLGKRERDWANAIKSGADHLAALTTLIVDAAKAQAAGLVLRNELFSPRALAQAVAEALQARAGSKGVATDIAIAGDLPPMVAGDALRLRAALENLADNAVKFTSHGGVTFTAAAKPAPHGRVRLVYTVVDTGIGIDKNDLKKLFRPFAQANAEIARQYGGAGLGLVFVKRIAKLMGGDLAVFSEPGRGTTFRLEVPVERATAPATAGGGAPAAPAKPLVLLCAEDNPYGRVVMNTILTELGHRIDFVEDGEAAVKAVEQGGYDAVLMDVTLPELDGIAATRAIRALPGNRGKVPVIGVSGRTDSGDEQEALAAGMNFYFAKPVSPGKLAAALAQLAAGG
jgi:CheY-like chemotaxis protein/nitrogen-specific signal transduction histidine kinase